MHALHQPLPVVEGLTLRKCFLLAKMAAALLGRSFP